MGERTQRRDPRHANHAKVHAIASLSDRAQEFNRAYALHRVHRGEPLHLWRNLQVHRNEGYSVRATAAVYNGSRLGRGRDRSLLLLYHLRDGRQDSLLCLCRYRVQSQRPLPCNYNRQRRQNYYYHHIQLLGGGDDCRCRSVLTV